MSENNKKFEDAGFPFGSMLKTAISMAPMGVGSYYAWRALGSNASIATTPDGMPALPGMETNAITSVGKKTGALLRNKFSGASRDKAALALAERITGDESFDKLWQKVEERRALIQSVLGTMDDPSVGLGDQQSMREALVGALDDTNASRDEIKEYLRKAIRSITDSGSSRAKQVFSSYFDEYKKVGNHLMPPVMEMKTGRAFREIDDNRIGKNREARSRVEKLRAAGANVTLFEVEEAQGRGIYARVEAAGGKGRGGRFIGNVPIDLSSQTTATKVIRMGENFQTAYTADQHFMDGYKASQRYRNGQSLDFDVMQKAGVIHGVETAMTNRLLSHIKKAGGIDKVNPFEFGESSRELLTTGSRAQPVLTRSSDPMNRWFAEHLTATRELSHAQVKIYGLEHINYKDKELRDMFPQVFSKFKGYDTGVAPGSLSIENREAGRSYSTIGIAGNQITQLRTGGVTDRFSLPSTARDNQMIGRPTAFLEHANRRRLGHGRFETGHGAKNIEWSEALTGASNRAILLDVSGKNLLKLDGMGEAYSTRGATVMQDWTKPVLDPTHHKVASTTLLNDLMAHDAAAPGTTKRITRSDFMGKYGGGFVGVGSDGTGQYLRMSPDLDYMDVGIERVADASGKKTIYLAGARSKDHKEGVKFFGTQFKGTQKNINEGQVYGMIKRFGYDKAKAFLASTGIDIKDVMLTSGDMLGKAPDMLNIQMISGLGVVTDVGEDVFSRIESLAKTRVYGKLEDNKTARIAEAVISELKRKGVSSDLAGAVLSGVYNLGDKHARRGFGVDQAKLEELIKTELGDGAVAAAKRGLAISASSLASGPMPDDWGQSRASIEPRTLKMMQQRLRTMGMSEAEVSEFMADIMGRKVGIGSQLSVVQSLHEMQESLLGMRGPASEFSDQVKRINVRDLIRMSSMGKDNDVLMKFLNEAEGGVVLDLNQDYGGAGFNRVQAEARKSFGGQGEVFIPGGKVLSEMKSAMVKGQGQAKEIAPDFVRTITGFLNDVVTLSSSDEMAKGAGETFDRFKAKVTSLAAGGRDSLSRGKIRGSQSFQGGSYDMTGSGYLTGKEAYKVRKAFSKTKGQAIFMSDNAFLSMLTDYMGGSKQSGSDLQRFFLGMEETGKKASSVRATGVISMMSRHPNLSFGHVAPAQIFRHIKETGKAGGEDFAWTQFMKTEEGKKALTDYEAITKTKIGGFSDMAKLAKNNDTATKAFFETMGTMLPKMATWEGGGLVFAPQIDLDITAGGKTKSTAFSISSAMIGDFDGDFYQIMMMDKDLGKKLMGSLKGDRGASYVAEDFKYKAASGILMTETKKALEAKGESFTGPTDINRVYQDVLKEKGMKQVGKLDVHLNSLRTAVIGFGHQNKSMQNLSLAMLKTLEEFAAIKGKKMDKYEDFANQIASSVEDLFVRGDAGNLRNLLKNRIFEGSDLFGDGIEVTDIKGAEEFGEVSFINKAVKGMKVNGNHIVDMLESVAKQAIDSGVSNQMESVGREAAALGREGAQDLFRIMSQGDSDFQSAVLNGYTGGVQDLVQGIASRAANRVVSAGATFNSKMVAPLALGALGSLLAGAALGDTGYAPEPLMMPGEVISSKVQEGMYDGNLFGGSGQVGPSPDQLGGGGGGLPMNSVINPGAAYMEQPNPYQVYGETNSPGGFAGSSGIMGQLARGTGASMTVNDRRRPITPNYVDRFLGEE